MTLLRTGRAFNSTLTHPLVDATTLLTSQFLGHDNLFIVLRPMNLIFPFTPITWKAIILRTCQPLSLSQSHGQYSLMPKSMVIF